MATSELLPTPTTGDRRSKNSKQQGINNVVETSTSSQAVFPASLFPTPEKDEVQRTIVFYGRKCFELYRRTSQHGSSLKTLVESLLLKAAWFSSKSVPIWRIKATEYKRLLFQLAPSTLHTGAIESGLLLTPTTVDRGERSDEAMQRKVEFRKSIGRRTVPPGSLSEQLSTGKMRNMIPTPQARDGRGGGTQHPGRSGQPDRHGIDKGWSWDENWTEVAAKLCRMDDGLSARLDGFELSKSAHRTQRLKALGNAIVPQVAVEIMKAISLQIQT